MANRPALRLERTPGSGAPGPVEALALRLQTDIALVDVAVELLARECFLARPPSRQTSFRLRVALAEALANAMLCGNAGDPGKTVQVSAELFPDRILLAVEDEGPGFDPAQVPDPRDPTLLDSPRGRGLFIIRNLADEVTFNDRGNVIWMTLPRW